MAEINLIDRLEFEGSCFDAAGKLKRRTSDGYALMDCAVARSGIQEYLAAEMGEAFKDRAPSEVVKLYRPPEVIFSDASLRSYTHKPLTNDHPPKGVNSENWSEVAPIGFTGDEAYQDTDRRRVRVPMLMADARAIADVEAGKIEWSAGYSVSFDVASGTTPDGQAYDAIVTGQKINHIALVDRGRAGPDCRIGDKHSASDDALKENRQMAEVKMQDGGIPFTVADATAEAVVKNIQTARDKAVSDLTAAQAQIATLTTDAATAVAEIATLKQAVEDSKVTPAQLRDAAAAYAKTVADAKAIAPSLTFADDATETAIKASVVNAKLGDAAKGWTEAQFDTSFATMAASISDSQDGIQRVIADGALQPMVDAEAKAHADYVARLSKKKAA